MTLPAGMDREAAKLLEEDAPELYAEAVNAEMRRQQALHPKPSLSDILSLRTELEGEWGPFQEKVNDYRDLRYQRDETPEKWKRHLSREGRVRTRLTHNEILRVVAMHTRNPVVFSKLPADDKEKDRDDAEEQARWANALIPHLERSSGLPLRRMAVDSQDGDGLVWWEFYLTDAYDDFEDMREDEDSRAFNKRRDRELRQAGLPFGWRPVDPLSVYARFDDKGARRVAIVEEKPYETVYASVAAKVDSDRWQELHFPKPGTPGAPVAQRVNAEGAWEMAETIRYYDRYWYAWIVAGELIELKPHGLPGCPMFPQYGIVTSSPQHSERYQGITWGMSELEKSLNDIMTLGVDVAFQNAKPRYAVETDAQRGEVVRDAKTGQPVRIDISDPDRVPQLAPGQKMVHINKGVNNEAVPQSLTQMFMSLWERSGLNPIAQGQSPGSDPAGYTVNTLMGASQAHYEGLLDNEATTLAKLMDFTFRVVRDVIGEAVYIPVATAGKVGHVQWLVLDPDVIDDSPFMAKIDPLADANRIALRQSLTQAWKDGLIARRRVQEEGFGIADPEAEDNEIIEDTALEKIVGILIEMVTNELRMSFQAEQPGPGPNTPAAVGQDPDAPGAVPAPVNAPEVGAAAMQSQRSSADAIGSGQRALPVSRAMAGQGQGPKVAVPA